MMQFAAASFREAISTCHNYQMRLKDIRRRYRPVWKNEAGVLTALDFKSAMLKDGSRCPAARCTLPRCVEPTAEEADPEGEEVDAAEAAAEAADFAAAFNEAGSGEIAMASQSVLGWMCSYRAKAPEKQSFANWRKRWTKARERHLDVKLHAPRIRPAVEEALRTQLAWRERRKVRK